jgi:hypothetical protein
MGILDWTYCLAGQRLIVVCSWFKITEDYDSVVNSGVNVCEESEDKADNLSAVLTQPVLPPV